MLAILQNGGAARVWFVTAVQEASGRNARGPATPHPDRPARAVGARRRADKYPQCMCRRSHDRERRDHCPPGSAIGRYRDARPRTWPIRRVSPGLRWSPRPGWVRPPWHGRARGSRCPSCPLGLTGKINRGGQAPECSGLGATGQRVFPTRLSAGTRPPQPPAGRRSVDVTPQVGLLAGLCARRSRVFLSHVLRDALPEFSEQLYD